MSAAHAARAFELYAGDNRDVGTDYIEKATGLAGSIVVDVLMRYPKAPSGRGRMGELGRRPDVSLRQLAANGCPVIALNGSGRPAGPACRGHYRSEWAARRASRHTACHTVCFAHAANSERRSRSGSFGAMIARAAARVAYSTGCSAAWVGPSDSRRADNRDGRCGPVVFVGESGRWPVVRRFRGRW